LTIYRFKMGDAFPADNPVARWLVTLSIALNDVVFAIKKAEPAEGPELSEYFRLACLRLWEVAKFIAETFRDLPEIKDYVDSLPEQAQECFTRIRGIVTESDPNYLGTDLVQIRSLFAHYQEMNPRAGQPRDPITRSLEEIANEEVTLDLPEKVGDLRLGHADAVVARTMLRLMVDEAAQKRLLGGVAERNGDVINFVQIALDQWLQSLPAGTLKST
jgi:hypothetical protein